MARWIFVRHGESTANAEGWLSGQVDVPLTDRGREQARAVGVAIAGEPLDRCLASDLIRAWETAELAVASWAQARGVPALPLQAMPAVRERHLGDWQHLPREELRMGGKMDLLLGWASKPPGAESHADMAARALPALAALPPVASTLVVAHGGMIRVLLGLIDGISRELIGKNKIPNAVPITRDLSPGTWAKLASALSGEGQER